MKPAWKEQEWSPDSPHVSDDNNEYHDANFELEEWDVQDSPGKSQRGIYPQLTLDAKSGNLASTNQQSGNLSPVTVEYFIGKDDGAKEESEFGGETRRVSYGSTSLVPPYEDFVKKDHSLYFRDGIRRVDFVLAYEESFNESLHLMRKEFEESLEKEGLELERDGRDVSFDGKTCFVKIHATWDVLARFAEFTNLKMPFQVDDMWNKFQSWYLPFPNPLLPKHPLLPESIDYFTAPFTRDHINQFLFKDKETFFTTAQRSRLVWEILIRIKYGESEARLRVGVNRLLAKKAYLDVFPLHEGEYKSEGELQPGNDRALLYELWASPRRWYFYQPLDLIRKYFGSKIGIYFTWLGFYTEMLFPAALMGLICFFYGLATYHSNTAGIDICDNEKLGSSLMCPLCTLTRCRFWYLNATCTYTKVTYLFDNGATVFFAVFMSFWATLFLEFWKRKQNEVIWKWDLQGFEESQEVIRPEFEAKVRRRKLNPVTQNGEMEIWNGLKTEINLPVTSRENWLTIMEPHLTFWDKMGRYWTSMSVILFMLFVVIASMVGVIAYRTSVATALYSVDTDIVKRTANISTSITAALINLVIIIFLNKVYERLALMLTEFERPRTQLEFEASYTFKMYLFQFLNFYSSLFYIAFFKGRFNGRPGKKLKRFLQVYTQDECEPAGCLIELCIQLATIMIGKQILNNFLEILFPMVSNWLRNRKHKQRLVNQNQGRVDIDYNLQPVPANALFDEYLEMVIQYGFVTMFVAAFPLAPFFALLNNIMEIRVDAYKYLTQLRRPVALRADSIGAWYDILDVVSHISVITNAFVIAFTTDMIPSLVYKYAYSDPTGENRTFQGFVNNSLSYINLKDFDNDTCDPVNLVEMQQNHTFCRFRDYRDNFDPYKRNMHYWYVFGVRLTFIVVFEHFIFFTTGLLAYCIADIPRYLKQLIRKEKQLQYDLLYKAEQDKIKKERHEKELSASNSHRGSSARIPHSRN